MFVCRPRRNDPLLRVLVAVLVAVSCHFTTTRTPPQASPWTGDMDNSATPPSKTENGAGLLANFAPHSLPDLGATSGQNAAVHEKSPLPSARPRSRMQRWKLPTQAMSPHRLLSARLTRRSSRCYSQGWSGPKAKAMQVIETQHSGRLPKTVPLAELFWPAQESLSKVKVMQDSLPKLAKWTLRGELSGMPPLVLTVAILLALAKRPVGLHNASSFHLSCMVVTLFAVVPSVHGKEDACRTESFCHANGCGLSTTCCNSNFFCGASCSVGNEDWCQFCPNGKVGWSGGTCNRSTDDQHDCTDDHCKDTCCVNCKRGPDCDTNPAHCGVHSTCCGGSCWSVNGNRGTTCHTCPAGNCSSVYCVDLSQPQVYQQQRLCNLYTAAGGPKWHTNYGRESCQTHIMVDTWQCYGVMCDATGNVPGM